MDQPAASKLAVIGNRESARKGMPLRKALYTEHAEVAAMSDAVVSDWQAERDIAVEGSSLRPVQSFDQSGETLMDPGFLGNRHPTSFCCIRYPHTGSTVRGV